MWTAYVNVLREILYSNIDKYIVYRILLLANFKHMFYQYLIKVSESWESLKVRVKSHYYEYVLVLIFFWRILIHMFIST